MQEAAARFRAAGERIAFVPTMGCLHEGHLSLMRWARRHADRLVVSIFVNPTQFGPKEDYRRYPRPFREDRRLCQGAGVDVLFHPSVRAMYRADHSVWVVEEALSQGLCGAHRPGHFRGVTTVVTKLLHAVQPDLAVFGQKDAQQAAIMRRMVLDLNMPVRIVVRPIVREPDGLAMSSRNRYLAPEERVQAVCLRRALETAERMVKGQGIRQTRRLRAAMRRVISRYPLARLEYIELVDAESLKPVKTVKSPVLAALAVRIGATRLIDNTVLKSGA